MKYYNINLFLTLLFTGVFIMSSCGHKHDHDGENEQNHKTEKQDKTIDKDSKEYASAYICPMHCDGSGGDSEGNCPVCKMDYVKNENFKANSENDDDDDDAEHDDDHDHNHDHEGHSH